MARKGVPVGIVLPPEWLAAVDEFAQAQVVPVARSAAVVALIQAGLRTLGPQFVPVAASSSKD